MLVAAYGDHYFDGVIQLSFVLPVPCDELAQPIATEYCKKLGFTEVKVVDARSYGEFTGFIVYVKSEVVLDTSTVKPVVRTRYKSQSIQNTRDYLLTLIGRPLVVVGATINTDAHTVGLDSILNAKGYNGHYGLEKYGITVHNLGSQVLTGDLVEYADRVNADFILVSQVVTQRDIHLKSLRSLAVATNTPVIIGGPEINDELAHSLGFVRGFGRNTVPSQVVEAIVDHLEQCQPVLVKRNENTTLSRS